MAEYIERQKTLDTVRKHKWNIVGTEEKVKENVLVDAIALDIYEDIPTADVVERSEYEKIKFERDISIQQLHDLGNSVSKAIEEIESKKYIIDIDRVLEILKRNIGEQLCTYYLTETP